MKPPVPTRNARRRQDGYALLLVAFLTAVLLVSSMSIGLRVLTDGRRQREEEMIWRGKQYTRGVKLFYRKYGRFPTSLDDLTKPGMGNIRFMRQAYKDPMNKEDGSWRLIYVGPAGQLIGSLKPQPSNLQLPQAAPQPGATPAAGAQTQPPSGGIAPAGTTGGSATPNGAAGASNTGNGAGATSTDSADSNGQSVPTGDTPTIVGGAIIGVGSKVNQSSVIVYDKAKNYRLFEFIWDPSKDLGVISSPGAPAGAPAGTPSQNPANPQGNPTAPQTNPPQNPNQP